MYTYLLKYEHEKEIYQLPIPPEKMVTKCTRTNKSYMGLGFGEINILKNSGLREIAMEILLPKDITLPFVQPKYAPNVILGEPIIYLSKFKEMHNGKKPIQLLITRILPNGEELFKGNIVVSLEEYDVREVALEEGCFYVGLVFKEYQYIDKNEIKEINKQKGTYAIVKNRTAKTPKDTYVVKAGDTLWGIAKKELNDETMYKNIMKINGIQDPKSLKIGETLRLI